MPNVLTRAYDATLAFFGFKPHAPEPDPRVDPEDRAAYEHFDKVETLFGTKAAPVQLLRDRTKKPTDVTEGWDDIRLDSPPAGFACWVDVYTGPLGSGYVTNYEAVRDGKVFHKAINIGPEKYREQDWTEVLDDKVVTPTRVIQ